MPNDSSIGAPARRREDLRLLRGAGRFSDDVDFAGQAYAAILRSPHAHALIRRIDAAAARALPGVLAVLTATEAAADGLGPILPDFAAAPPIAVQRQMPDVVLENRDGMPIFPAPYPLLAGERVRFVGQAVAMVVAETLASAKDGVEAIAVTYEPLPAVTGSADAAKPEAPRLWEGTPSNVCLDAEVGDAAATAAAFARARHVVRLDTWIQRVTGVPMEPRTAVGRYDPATGRYHLHAGSGGVVRQRREIAEILGVPLEQVRVTADDIGGNFGTKNSLYPEFPLVLWAARRLGRPVKWTAERHEAMVSDYQGRDLRVRAELALDADGTFLAMRGENLSNLGAHAASIVPLRKGVGIMTGLYRIPVAHFRARAVFTNTASTIPYRSAGRPEAIFVLERLVDLAANQCGFDRAELRRKNLVPPDALPYRNPLGVTYDNGDYAAVLERAQALGDWAEFPARRVEARARGRLRGIGVAPYIEITMGYPRERAEITVHPGGLVEVAVGTQSTGQGHETSFSQCVAEWLGVAFDAVRLVSGDTDRIPVGGGSHSGRSMRMAGVVMGKAAERVILKARRIAAFLLEAAEADLDYGDGRFVIAGTDRALTLFEVAGAAFARRDLPAELRGPLAADCDESFKVAGFPYGCHVCEVEIDPETGVVALASYAAVDDVGRAVNPLILEGQTHGGIAQGVGQALWEEAAYDPATGQLLTGSFMDYAMPRADGLPAFATALSEVPSPTNPLGIRAGGEGGTTPALAVVVNAIVDALAEFGVTHIEMPATPERVWRAMRGR